MRLRFTPQAQKDIEKIYAYLNQRSPSGAYNVSVAIYAAARFVAEHPGHGDARLLLGYLHYAGGDPEAAAAVLDGLAAATADDEVVALLHAAVIRVMQGGGVGE